MVWLAQCLLGVLCLALAASQALAATTWAPTNGPFGGNILALAIDPTTPATLYAATGGGVFKSTNGGDSWSAVNAGLGSVTVQTLAIDPSTPATLYAGTYGGVFKSTNGGASWSAVNAGLGTTNVQALAIDPSTPTTLYAGTWGNSVFKGSSTPDAPSAPTAATATTGDQQVSVSWTAPSSDGGSAITGYTVTASPASPGGTCTATPPATTCTIGGLTNGTAYTFTVVATNAVGSSAPSAPSSAVTPLAALAQTLPLPGGAGNASVLISGGPPGCAVAAGDIAFSSTAPAGHPGTVSALGALAFTAKGCPGATLTISINYPAGSLNGLTPYKFGPKAAGAAPSWFAHGTISGDTVSYSVTDDGVGDNDTSTAGQIRDPFALLLAAPPPATAQPIPTLSEWAMLLLSALTAALGLGTLRRRQGQGV